MPWIRQNLSLVIVAIIVISLVPVAVGYVRHRTAP
jgi:membrane-associated protein